MTEIIIGLIQFAMGSLNSAVSMFTFSDYVSQGINGMTTVAGVVLNFIASVNFLVPIPTIFKICVLTLVMDIFVFGYWLVNKVINAVLEVIP